MLNQHLLSTVGLVAVLALGAPVFPAVAVQATDLDCKKCVHNKDLAKKAVSKAKLKNGAVSKKKLKDKAVSTEKIKDGAVTGDKMAPGAVTEEKLAPDLMDEVKMGAEGAVAVYDQNGMNLGAVPYMPAPSIVYAIARSNGYAGFIQSVGAQHIAASGAAYYEAVGCVGQPYGIFIPNFLTQYAVIAEPVGGPLAMYVPKLDQVVINKAYNSTQGCGPTWDPVGSTWMSNCSCTTPDVGMADLMPLEEAYKIGDLVGPLTVGNP